MTRRHRGRSAARESRDESPPEVLVLYRRPGEGETRYRQELIRDGADWKLTLYRIPADADALEVGPGGGTRLPPGSSLLWFTVPDRPWEIAAFHTPEGELAGHYTNLIEPPDLDGNTWHITDRWLDLWQPAGGEPRILDEDELREAVEAGHVTAEEARELEERASRLLARAREGGWPPAPIRSIRLEDLPSLRFRRDDPGGYYANLVVGRIIAWGMYWMGAASLTSVGFAAFTEALSGEPTAGRIWIGTLIGEGVLLLPLALTGRLPATRRPRPKEAIGEGTLFMTAVVMGAIVLALNESTMWRELFTAVYGILGSFLGIFGYSRWRHDDRFSGLAFGGLLVTLLALFLLL